MHSPILHPFGCFCKSILAANAVLTSTRKTLVVHGLFLSQFAKFIRCTSGEETLRDVMRAAGINVSVFIPMHDYPEALWSRLLGAYVEKQATSRNVVLNDFGTASIVKILDIYKDSLGPKGGTLELIRAAPALYASLHTAPARLPFSIRDTAEDELELIYDSPRRMCAFLAGALEGSASYFGERIQICHRVCIEDQSDFCLFYLRRAPVQLTVI